MIVCAIANSCQPSCTIMCRFEIQVRKRGNLCSSNIDTHYLAISSRIAAFVGTGTPSCLYQSWRYLSGISRCQPSRDQHWCLNTVSLNENEKEFEWNVWVKSLLLSCWNHKISSTWMRRFFFSFYVSQAHKQNNFLLRRGKAGQMPWNLFPSSRWVGLFDVETRQSSRFCRFSRK